MKKTGNIINMVYLLIGIGLLIIVTTVRVTSWFSAIVVLMIIVNVYRLCLANGNSYNRSEDEYLQNVDRVFLKDETVRKIIEKESQEAPSKHFAVFGAFTVIEKQRESFEQIVRSNVPAKLWFFFANAYSQFINYPESDVFSPELINKDKNDTSPQKWYADMIPMRADDYAALLYIPVKHDRLAGRIVGVVLGDVEYAYYYCMLSKKDLPSIVIRRRLELNSKNMYKEIGTVKGHGLGAMYQFFHCIENNYYGTDQLEEE